MEEGRRWRGLGQYSYAGAMHDKDLYARILNVEAPWRVADVELDERAGSATASDSATPLEEAEGNTRDAASARRRGTLQDGTRTRSEQGTPQGGSASPLLANVYLHYAFDLWVQQWRRTQARDDVVVVRYADDIVAGFQHRSDAERFWGELAERFSSFALELHPVKTRLIEFGPFAAENRRRRGQGKPETFDFLGFTHICATKRSNGRFTVLRQTMGERLQANLGQVKAELRGRLHDPVPEVGRWLRSVVGGHLRYYGVPMNSPALALFRYRVAWLWYRSLRRRSQKTRLTWERMRRLIERWLPARPACTIPIPYGDLASYPR